MLHYMRIAFSRTQARTGKAAAARAAAACRAPQLAPIGTLPVQGRRAERLRLRLHQPRQSRTLDAAAEGDRPRGPDRRPALRHPAGARRARGRGQRDDRRLDPPAHQARGDGDHRRGRRAGRRGARHDGTDATIRRFEQRGIMQTIEHPTTGAFKMAALAGALLRQPAAGRSRRRCWASNRRRAGDWLGMTLARRACGEGVEHHPSAGVPGSPGRRDRPMVRRWRMMAG